MDGFPRPQSESFSELCDSKLVEKYEGFYEEKYYFSEMNELGEFKSLMKSSDAYKGKNKATYIGVYNNCKVNIFVNSNSKLKKEDLNPEKGLIGILYRAKNGDYIKYFSVRDGVGRTIYRNFILKKDTLIVRETGSNTNGYIYVRKEIPEEWKRYKTE